MKYHMHLDKAGTYGEYKVVKYTANDKRGPLIARYEEGVVFPNTAVVTATLYTSNGKGWPRTFPLKDRDKADKSIEAWLEHEGFTEEGSSSMNCKTYND